MDRYVVRRRETIVEPKEVETGRRVTKLLNIVFLTWSVLVVIMYFASIDIPDYVDIGISIFAITVSIAYQSYKWYFYKKSEIGKVMEDPDISRARKIEDGQMNRRQAVNLDSELLNLDSIKINVDK